MKNYKLEGLSQETTIDYKECLNEQQLNAVTKSDGACMVLAGAGSGKTRILIYRLAYLLEHGIEQKNILLVTFTNKAAHEMINRAECLIKTNLNDLWIGTFHHIGNMMLRKECSQLGYAANFTIIDREDSKGFLEDCLDDLGLYKQNKLFPKKNILINIRSLSVNCQRNVSDIIADYHPHLEEFTSNIKKVLSLYDKKKKEANTMDFDDLLVNWLKLLNNDIIRDKYSQLFEYILVDEYQDTNRIQFEILKKLCYCHKNILVVGDDAQSIYSFRGAEIKNLLDFPKIFNGGKIFKLEKNYRSSPEILHLANDIIKHNINQFPKKLRATRGGSQVPAVVKTQDVYQQAKFIGQRIAEIHQEGTPLQEIAVLFRSRFQALELEVELLKRNIPYIMRGGQKFFEQAHIKDIMAYLKVTVNPKDELSFKRAICLYRGIGRSFANKIWAKLTREKKSPAEVAKGLSAKPQASFKEFNSLVSTIQENQNPQQAIKDILEQYKDYCYVSFDNPDERMLDLEELAKMAINYETVKSFLLDLNAYEDFKSETLMDITRRDEVLVLSTIHQAKGLEWDSVFIIGFSDYEFPHPKALNNDKATEEERRLFYVAVTRAKDKLYITYPQNKYTFKNGLIVSRASMFFYELATDCYEEWNVQGTNHLL